MPNIKPISYLRNTKELMKLCDKSNDAIYLTKNGYKALTILNSDKYDRDIAQLEIYKKIVEATNDIKEGKVYDARKEIEKLDKKYGF